MIQCNKHGLVMSHTMTASQKPSFRGHLGRWAVLCSAKEMLHGQHQRVDILALSGTAHKGLLQKRLEEDLCLIIPHVLLMTQ